MNVEGFKPVPRLFTSNYLEILRLGMLGAMLRRGISIAAAEAALRDGFAPDGTTVWIREADDFPGCFILQRTGTATAESIDEAYWKNYFIEHGPKHGINVGALGAPVELAPDPANGPLFRFDERFNLIPVFQLSIVSLSSGVL